MDREAFREKLLAKKKKKPDISSDVVTQMQDLLDQLKEVVASLKDPKPEGPVDFTVTKRDLDGRVKSFKVS